TRQNLQRGAEGIHRYMRRGPENTPSLHPRNVSWSSRSRSQGVMGFELCRNRVIPIQHPTIRTIARVIDAWLTTRPTTASTPRIPHPMWPMRTSTPLIVTRRLLSILAPPPPNDTSTGPYSTPPPDALPGLY